MDKINIYIELLIMLNKKNNKWCNYYLKIMLVTKNEEEEEKTKHLLE